MTVNVTIKNPRQIIILIIVLFFVISMIISLFIWNDYRWNNNYQYHMASIAVDDLERKIEQAIRKSETRFNDFLQSDKHFLDELVVQARMQNQLQRHIQTALPEAEGYVLLNKIGMIQFASKTITQEKMSAILVSSMLKKNANYALIRVGQDDIPSQIIVWHHLGSGATASTLVVFFPLPVIQQQLAMKNSNKWRIMLRNNDLRAAHKIKKQENVLYQNGYFVSIPNTTWEIFFQFDHNWLQSEQSNFIKKISLTLMILAGIGFWLCYRLARYKLLFCSDKKISAGIDHFAICTLDAIQEGVIVTNECGSVAYLNPVAQKITGWSLEDAKNKNVAQVFPAQERIKTKKEQSGLSSCEAMICFESSICKDGKTLYIEKTVTPLRDDQDRIIGFAWVLRDYSQRANFERELKQSAMVFEHSIEGIMILDKEKKITRVNEAFVRVTGYTSSEVIGQDHSILQSGRHGNDFYKIMFNTLECNGYWQGEVWHRRKNGEVFPEWLSVSVVYDQEKEGVISSYVCIINDISEKKLSEERIHHLAYFDPLTNLPNRTLFQDRLYHALTYAKRNNTWVVLMHLDLDRFKYINDTYGHPAGDRLLQIATDRLTHCVRANDTIARMGGDEFTIIMGDMQTSHQAIAAARNVSGKVCSAITSPFSIYDKEAILTCSIGIALYPQDGQEEAELLRNADTAMYHAKAKGKNNAKFYANEMNIAARQCFLIENNLRRALARNEFSLVYQPQIDLSSGKICGVESLIRWPRGTDEIISPMEFIPIAEETGLIVEIGHWVMVQVCQQIVQWMTDHVHLNRVAINVSGRQFREPSFIKSVLSILESSQVNPNMIELEVTESSLIEDMDTAIEALTEFKKHGIKIAIDDFGTGYSSLSYLKRFPVDTIKIDQSFISDMLTSKDDAEIVTAVIAIGHSLNLRVIGEGVETPEQLNFLAAKCCDEAQGFVLSKPLLAHEITEVLCQRKILSGIMTNSP